MTIIGLAGYARSGKTSIGTEIPGVHSAFAWSLKYRAAKALNVTMATIEERKHEFRPLLVELARAGRMLDPMTWVSVVMDEIDEGGWVGPGEPIWIIDDVRYVNECEAIRQRGGHVFYISRPRLRWPRLPAWFPFNRTTVGPANTEERDSIDELRRVLKPVEIVNDGTPEEAAAKVLELVKGCVKV